MIDLEPIAYAHRWISELFRKTPERARNTAVSTTRIDDALTCHIEEGPWKLVADLSTKAGGGGKGPTPGVLGRGALGSCVAMGVVLEAARTGVPISSVEVEVQTDYDDGAMFGTSDAYPGYLDVRCRISIESSAPEEDLQRMVDAAAERTPYLDVFGRAQAIQRTLRVLTPDSSP